VTAGPSRQCEDMAFYQQQQFTWSDEPKVSTTLDAQLEPCVATPTPVSNSEFEPLKALSFTDVPVAPPLASAIEHGVFGATTAGPIEPDEDEIQAITAEQARELMSLLADLQSVEDALRTGEDPRTGKVPKTPETQTKLREYLEREAPRLATAYGDSLAAYTNAFGDDAARRLDFWVRKTVADCTLAPSHRYGPSHPWHYLKEGDDAPPIAVEDIGPDLGSGQFLERDLPKNRVKRAARIRELLVHERQRVEEHKQRYQDIVERGAEALSRYDREIAHTSDEMARATALSLKYSHICWGLGRLAWLERASGGPSLSALSSDSPRDTPKE